MLCDFYETYKDDDLIVQKWLQIQAFADKDDVIEDVKRLMKHKAFDIKNPNKIYALIFPFLTEII
jgi:aminopeptidase N